MKGYRVWAEIDLSLLRDNIYNLKKHLNGETKLMAVVKADAYGHGAVAISNFCINNGCDYLGVGDSTEALELRDSGVVAPILVLGAVIEEELPLLISNNIELAVHSKDLLTKIDEESKKQNKRASVHLKIDTGLHRFGISPQNCEGIVETISKYSNIRIKGIFSHFASAYRDIERTKEQLNTFMQTVTKTCKKYNLKDIMIHIANSGGAVALQNSQQNMIRSGGALYGLIGNNEFKQILSLKTQVTYLKKVYKNSLVGYDGTFKCEKDTLLAICPVGYNDGIPTCYANSFEAHINGQKSQFAGKVAMDYITLDVSNIRDITVGQEVVIYDRQHNNIFDVAKKYNLNRYEITCTLSKRVKRVYIEYENETIKRFIKSQKYYHPKKNGSRKTALTP
ncbi:MAG: alanine racemase [Planctomycetes bacterium]|nr:alanine racemase [Planctomycetota bacterium]